jgi:hypothetical protein
MNKMGHLWMLQAYTKLAQSFNLCQIKLLDGLCLFTYLVDKGTDLLCNLGGVFSSGDFQYINCYFQFMIPGVTKKA